MSLLLIILFGGQCAALLLWGLLRKGRILELPFLFACTLTGFALPQLIGLLSDPSLPSGAVDKLLVMANLSTLMMYVGYSKANRPLRIMNWSYAGPALQFCALGMVLVGCFFFFLISRLPEEITEQAQWSGLPIVYLFFATLMSYGFALATLLWGAFRSKLCLLLMLVAAVFYLDRILVTARRGVASEFLLVLLCGLWFTRRWCPPRFGMFAFALVAILAVNSAREIRQTTMQGASYGSIFQGTSAPSVQGLGAIQYIENLKQRTEEGGVELRNAALDIEATSRTMNLDYGLSLWNSMVGHYVPAQFVGAENKEALLADLPDDTYSQFSYVARVGSTHTGFSDSFRSFWYFGCLAFFAIGWLMRKLYLAAMQGHLAAQLFYMLIATRALHAITHGIDWFLWPWPHMLVFLGGALVLARIPPRTRLPLEAQSAVPPPMANPQQGLTA